jgi:PAS domain-containing protein
MNKSHLQLIKQLDKFASAFSSIITLEGLIQCVEKILDETFKTEYSGLYVYDPSETRLKLIYSRGYKKDEIYIAEHNAMSRLPGLVYQTGKKIYIPDALLNNNEFTKSDTYSNDIRTRLYLPVMNVDQVIGAFEMTDSKPTIFNKEDIAILGFICNLAGASYGKILNQKELTKIIPVSVNSENAIAITKEKEQFDAFQIANLRFKSLISSMQAGVMVEDDKRRVVLVNQNFCDLFSITLPPEQIIGMNCEAAAEVTKELFTDPTSFIQDIQSSLAIGQVITNFELQMTNGTSLERDFIPLTDSGNKNHGILWIYRDITQRKKDERDLLVKAKY